jgi:predicted dehydrogenase
MSKIRVAVVGAGTFGRNHLRVIRQIDRAARVAVVDADKSRAADAAARYECAAPSSLAELEGQVDAAIVATPTTTHVDIAAEE